MNPELLMRMQEETRKHKKKNKGFLDEYRDFMGKVHHYRDMARNIYNILESPAAYNLSNLISTQQFYR